MMEKLQGFSNGKVNVGVSGQEIINDYEAKRGDVSERVEALTVTHRILSTCKLASARHPASWLTVRSANDADRAPGIHPHSY